MKASTELGKRVLDLLLGIPTLILVSPLFAAIAVLIKLDTKGPVFYRQERVGRRESRFMIFKFRTMVVGAYRSGARLTVSRDPRITRVGHLLRWTKLDELPQLINVVLGDMSLVGPRPEDSYFTNYYTPEQREVLSVRPGMIGPSQMDGRDEIEKYPEGTVDNEGYYIKHILPEKLARDLEYVRSATVAGDVWYLVGGSFRLLLSQFKTGFFARNKARFALAIADAVLMVAAYTLANLVKFDWRIPAKALPYILQTIPWILLLRPPVFLYFGLYQRSIRWITRTDFAAIVKAVSVSSALIVSVEYFAGVYGHSRAVFLIDWVLLIFAVSLSRYLIRILITNRRRSGRALPMINVLVAGSGHGAESILRALLEDPSSRYMPVGIIDHEPGRWGGLIHGIKVMGGASDIAMAASTHGVKMVLISLADLNPMEVRDITEACRALDMEYRLLPALSDMLEHARTGSVDMASLSSEGSL
ncbi:MAG: sugar transferase [Candidatus Binatia bacterium]